MRTLKLMDVFEASYNSDSTEGRGHGVHLGYFTHEADAKKAVIGMGVMGTPGDVRRVTTNITVYDSFAEYQKDSRDQTRKLALKKLTHEEREALGLNDDQDQD